MVSLEIAIGGVISSPNIKYANLLVFPMEYDAYTADPQSIDIIVALELFDVELVYVSCKQGSKRFLKVTPFLQI
ncbi:MAG: hypothetical protein AAB582_00295 [Patescibacteria group bacterium]